MRGSTEIAQHLGHQPQSRLTGNLLVYGVQVVWLHTRTQLETQERTADWQLMRNLPVKEELRLRH